MYIYGLRNLLILNNTIKMVETKPLLPSSHNKDTKYSALFQTGEKRRKGKFA